MISLRVFFFGGGGLGEGFGDALFDFVGEFGVVFEDFLCGFASLCYLLCLRS